MRGKIRKGKKRKGGKRGKGKRDPIQLKFLASPVSLGNTSVTVCQKFNVHHAVHR